MARLHVYLRPPTLSAGIGCRRGTGSAAIFAALSDACRRTGRSVRSVAVLGTTVAKQDEIGLLSLSQQLAIPLECFDNGRMDAVIREQGLETSGFVAGRIGVGNVCEAAALLSARSDRLLLPKTVYGGITVALAEAVLPSSD